jgi:hypothetical protein
LWCITRPDLFAPALTQAGLKSDRVIYLEAGPPTLPLRQHARARAQLGEQVDRHARAAKRRIPAHDLAYQPIFGRRSGRAD